MLTRVTLIFATALGLYALFAGEVSATEAIAGVPLAAGMTAYAEFLHQQRHRDLRLGAAPWGRLLAKPVASLLPDALRVGRVLLRVLPRRAKGSVGVVSSQPFRSGGGDPADAGRRGLVTLAISLAPNGYALEIPGGEDVLVLHRLVATAPALDREWPL